MPEKSVSHTMIMIVLKTVLQLLYHGYQYQINDTQSNSNDKQYIDQRIDHFNFNNLSVTYFKQKFYENKDFSKDDNEVQAAVLHIGGEGPVNSAPYGSDVSGAIAKKYKARMYQLEHRFYGESQPFAQFDKEEPLKSEYLQYLTSRQATADLINFVVTTDKKFCEIQKKKWIPGKTCLVWLLVGGSYPGAMAGWIMQQHPNLFAASISSSGVVDAKFELQEFDIHTLAAAGLPCANFIMAAMRDIEYDVEVNKNDKYLTELGGNRKNLADFYYFLADQSLMIMQYASWKTICQTKFKPVWEQAGDVTGVFVDFMKTKGYSMYDRDSLKKTSDSGMFRQWWYQTCTEVAYFQPAPLNNSVRSKMVTTQWHLDICKYCFDNLSIGDPTARTDLWYGNKKIYGPDTFFANFWQDIWHISGITEATPNVPIENIGYANCRDCAHCADLSGYNENGTTPLDNVKKQENKFVDQRFSSWIERK